MPNGVSCLFFAGKNLVYGNKEKNVFKEGIGVIQSVRTADFLASANLQNSVAAAGTSSTEAAVSSVSSGINTAACAVTKNPVLGAIKNAAAFLKKLLYPCIIASGIYNTAKSEDKIKTGTGQAAGIGLMYTFEKIAEKTLNTIDKSLSKNQSGQKSLPSKIAWYILRGGIYAASSLLGYNTGNKIAENSVDAIRNFKAGKELKEQTENMFISEEENNQYNMEPEIFNEIESVF